MRTTLDIDAPVLKELKRLQLRERKSLGRLVSDLLAVALKRNPSKSEGPVEFHWTARRMGSRVDLADRESIFELMEPPPARGKRRR
ncbi:MAG: antitoxin [Acidobacteria bacterium]|nr:antitoxin [Acidobacteriota bacterium]